MGAGESKQTKKKEIFWYQSFEPCCPVGPMTGVSRTSLPQLGTAGYSLTKLGLGWLSPSGRPSLAAYCVGHGLWRLFIQLVGSDYTLSASMEHTCPLGLAGGVEGGQGGFLGSVSTHLPMFPKLGENIKRPSPGSLFFLP